MNERFFELDKRKQDRIINAALSVFTENGFSNASTDEITGRAGISKGLIFHYFGSKRGTYAFLYEYSVRYTLLALKNEFREKERDLFRLCRRIARAEAMILETYPCMLLFPLQAEAEKDPGIADDISFMRGRISLAYRSLYEQVYVPEGFTEKEAEVILKMLELCRKGVLREMLESGDISGSRYLETTQQFIDILGKTSLQ